MNPGTPAPPRENPERVAVVGFGMAAGRLLDELLARRDDGRCRRDVEVTVVGAEPYGSYNRILLTEVLAGRADVAALGTADPVAYAARGVDVRLGRQAVALDLAGPTVSLLLDDGSCLTADRVVLATGADPVVPPIAGLGREHLPAGVHAFRTLDDCREIVAAASTARRAVVLGGGLLGLETARGIAGRGPEVTVLHAGPHLLERQLDLEAATVLSVALQRLGLHVQPGARVRGVETTRGRLSALLLDGGVRLEADLLVLACGVRPRTALAARAGLRVERGVVVDDLLRASDPRVTAIGDCAEHAGQVPGLVAPAWEQARVVADLLSGADPGARHRGHRAAVRLKAADVEVASAGEALTDVWDPRRRVVRLVDPARGRYVKVVVDGGRIVGAMAVGDARAAADLTLMVDRGTAAPEDPAVLLLPSARRSAPAVDDPTLVPDRATVCRCNGVTKGDLVRAWEGGARSVADASRSTRACTGCGTCSDVVRGLFEWLAAADPDPLEDVPGPARAPAPGGAGSSPTPRSRPRPSPTTSSPRPSSPTPSSRPSPPTSSPTPLSPTPLSPTAGGAR